MNGQSKIKSIQKPAKHTKKLNNRKYIELDTMSNIFEACNKLYKLKTTFRVVTKRMGGCGSPQMTPFRWWDGEKR